MSSSYQDYELVKSKMEQMRLVFDEYIKVIEAMNTDIEDNINNGSVSALESNVLGKPFKDKWEVLYTDFKNLEIIFSNAYNNVASTTEANAELEEYAASSFGSDAKASSTPDQSGVQQGGSVTHGFNGNPQNNRARVDLLK